MNLQQLQEKMEKEIKTSESGCLLCGKDHRDAIDFIKQAQKEAFEAGVKSREGTCPECQFEEKHSQVCSQYVWKPFDY